MKILFFLLLIITSCKTINQELDPKVYYKRDIKIKYDDKSYNGIAVLPYILNKNYEVEFESNGKLNLFTITSCHREEVYENEYNNFNSKKIELGFSLNPEFEKEGCPIQLGAYDLKGRHSWGFIDYKTGAHLSAIIDCNGKKYLSTGVTICQSKQGLIQSITFKHEVVFSPESQLRKECKNISYETTDNKMFVYAIPNRECVYEFMRKDKPEEVHRLTTIGYEKIKLNEL